MRGGEIIRPADGGASIEHREMKEASHRAPAGAAVHMRDGQGIATRPLHQRVHGDWPGQTGLTTRGRMARAPRGGPVLVGDG